MAETQAISKFLQTKRVKNLTYLQESWEPLK